MTRAALSLWALAAACASRSPAAPVAPAQWPAAVDAATAHDVAAADVPAGPAALTGVTRIALTTEAQCALRGDGTAWCWHGPAHLEAPAGPYQPTEVASVGARVVPGLRDVDALCLGSDALCARRRDGAVTCRAIRSPDNTEAPEGSGEVLEGTVPGAPAERLDDLGGACVLTLRDGRQERVVAPIDARGAWARAPLTPNTPQCELRDGVPRCRGSNEHGLLANSPAPFVDASAPSALFGLRDLREVRFAGRHACAVTLDGAVLCWGRNHDGQLGTGDARSRALPTRVPGIDGVRAVRLGLAFTCALREAGDVWCWGASGRGRYADRDPAPRPRPTRLRQVSDLTALEATEFTLCGTRADGTVWCWGDVGPIPAGASAAEPRRVDLAR